MIELIILVYAARAVSVILIVVEATQEDDLKVRTIKIR